MSSNKVLELAHKLKALAERGVGGEKVNAETMLKNLLEKHNLSLESLENPTRYATVLKFKYRHKLVMLHSILMNMSENTPVYGIKNSKTEFGIDCTKAELIAIEATYDFFSRKYDDELRIFTHAFIQRNRMFSSDSKGTDFNSLSAKEKQEAKRIMNMADSMEKHTMYKQLKKETV